MYAHAVDDEALPIEGERTGHRSNPSFTDEQS